MATLQSATPEERAIIGTPRLSAAIDAYLKDLVHRRRSETTHIGYKCQLYILADHAAGKTLHDIDEAFLRDFLDGKKGKRDERLRDSTLRKEVAVLRSFFAFCMSHGWTRRNPAKGIHKPRAPRFVTLPLDQREISRLIEFANGMLGRRGIETRAVLFTLLYTGLRISDVSQLKRGSFNHRTGYLTLPWTQKTGAPVRLKIHADAVRALDQLPNPNNGELWFYLNGLKKEASRIRKLRRRLDYLGEKVGIRANPHRFRDTFAVELLTQGADLRTVQHLLGHDSIETTERHYAHFVAEHQALLDRATAALQFGQQPARPFIVNSSKD